MALVNIGTEDSPQWVEGYWEGGYGDEAPIFRRADAMMQSGNAEDGYRMISDPRISGLSALDQRMRDLGYKELWGQYDPNGNRLAGGFLEGYWQDPATGKIYGTGQSPAQWYYGQTPDPTTGGWYVGNDPEAVKQQALSYGAKARTSGGDFITNFMDSGGGVAALMALAGMGAATNFGGALGGLEGGITGATGSYSAPTAVAGTSEIAPAALPSATPYSPVDFSYLSSNWTPQTFYNPATGLAESVSAGSNLFQTLSQIPTPPSIPQTPASLPPTTPASPTDYSNLPQNWTPQTEFNPLTGMSQSIPLNQATTANPPTTALGRILSGQGTMQDWLQVGGGLGSTILGALGSDAQRSALNSAADQYLNMGAPYRSLLAQSYMPGFTMNNEPGYKDAIDASTNSFLRAASAGRAPGVSGGNPMDNPGAWAETQKYVTANTALPQLNTYRSQLGSFGQLGTNIAGTANLNAAAGAGNAYNAAGYGLGQITNPSSSLDDLLKRFQQMSTSGTNSTYRPSGVNTF